MAMNRSITVTILLALSLFSALASATLPLDPTEYGHGSTDPMTSTTNTLLLPSEPEPVATSEIKPDQVRESWILDLTELEAINNNNRGEAASLEAQTAPLRLRPVNRNFFPKRPMFVRRNRGGCHHHGEPMVKPWAPREPMVKPRAPEARENPQELLSFGNDMVMMAQDERQLDGKFQSVDRQRLWIVRPSENGERREEANDMIPLHPHHGHHRHDHHDRHEEDEGRGEDDIDRDHHHHHDHDEDGGHGDDDMDRDHHHHHDHDEEREEEEMGGRGGIFKGIRKFLNHF